MSADQFSAAEHVNSPAQIATVLKRLQEEHALLIASFPNDNRIYNTAILSVDVPGNRVILDELNPAEGHARVQPGCELQLHGQISGIDTRCVVQIAEIELEDGIHLYRAVLPRYMIYRQRREFVRVPVRMTLDIGVSLTCGDKAVQARLADLSAGGIGGVVLAGDRLAIGDCCDCEIVLPDQSTLRAQAEIRFIVDEAGRQRRVGARFLALAPQDMRRIERIVMQLQRELRRI